MSGRDEPSRFWRDSAECHSHPWLPPEAWDLHWHDHPRSPSAEQREMNREARKVCDSCPVRTFCLEAAPAEDTTGVTIRWTYFPKDVKYAASSRKGPAPTRTPRLARPDDNR